MTRLSQKKKIVTRAIIVIRTVLLECVIDVEHSQVISVAVSESALRFIGSLLSFFRTDETVGY
jgi:hypothetical protein